MPIPDFGNDGLLPPGRRFDEWQGTPIHWGHPCTFAEVEKRFDEDVVHSLTRPALVNEIGRILDFAKGHVDCFVLFISGALVTSGVDPRSAFIVLQVTGTEFEQLDRAERWFIQRFFGDLEYSWGESDELIMQTGLAITYPEGHHKHQESKTSAMIHRSIAGEPIPSEGAHGYLEILECDEGVDEIDTVTTAPAS